MENEITPEMSLNDIIRKYPKDHGGINRFNVGTCLRRREKP